MGKKNAWYGKHHTTKTKVSNLRKEQWQNAAFSKMMWESWDVKPNKSEIFLQSILDKYFPNEWKYVGNGQLIIGRKCPDFTNINGKKALIELYGTYWHRGEDPMERINLFMEYGYNTLVIWESELKDKDALVQKIKDFSEN